MTEALYHTILAILAALIAPFLWYALRTNLRESRLKSSILSLQKENTEFKNKMMVSEKEILNLKDKNNEQQEQITNYSTKVSIFAKYTFDRHMGFLKSKTDGKPYCTACFLEFKEIELHAKRNSFECPGCGAEYHNR